MNPRLIHELRHHENPLRIESIGRHASTMIVVFVVLVALTLLVALDGEESGHGG